MSGVYESPFSNRYGSSKMREIFSAKRKYTTWRKLWSTLAEGEQSLGLCISDEQIAEMWSNVENIDYERVREIEREVHHDVVAHLRAFAEQCPKASPIIHLGATSAFITDNTDIMVMHEALSVIRSKCMSLVRDMDSMGAKHKNTPALAYTHFQPAQPTTFGKRVCMWAQDLEEDTHRLMSEQGVHMRLLGCKGATGTCASFMGLFDGDYSKVVELDSYLSNNIGMRVVELSGQTYSRKRDYYVFSVMAGVAQTLAKIANDMRLMAGKGEFSEPFENKQVGSSAMAYKQNPIRCEKIVSLSRFVISNTMAIADTAANQWMERSLDDSAIRRIVIPETFLALDEMLNTMSVILGGCSIHKEVMMENLQLEIPKLVSEGALMLAVKKGGNRQELHELIRKYTTLDHADFAGVVVSDKRFNINDQEMAELLDVSKLIGAAPMQVDRYLRNKHVEELV